MPYICVRRTDIPEGVLQVLDLVPNTSLRNEIYDPPGQTKYLRRLDNDTVATVASGGNTVTVAEYKGLAAYLIDNVCDTPNGDALTAAQANTIAAALIVALNSGAAMTTAAINVIIAATVAGSGIGVGVSTATLAGFLNVFAGAEYVLPAASATEVPTGTFSTTVRGSFTAGQSRHTYDSGALNISCGEGQLYALKQSTFSYVSVTGAAVVVYSDAGAVM